MGLAASGLDTVFSDFRFDVGELKKNMFACSGGDEKTALGFLFEYWVGVDFVMVNEAPGYQEI